MFDVFYIIPLCALKLPKFIRRYRPIQSVQHALKLYTPMVNIWTGAYISVSVLPTDVSKFKKFCQNSSQNLG